MCKVSIIANFYKSEKYIPRLVKSVLNQTYTDWELICVNDCSPGKDSELLHAYAEKDTRIKVIDNKENQGISKAKFIGISASQGEYLMFIDGDDWLEPLAIGRCVEPAEKYHIDMVVMGSQKLLLPFNYKVKGVFGDVNRVIRNPELFDRYYVNFFGCNMFSVTYWGKLIRKEAFLRAKLVASPSDYSEDLIFNMMLFPHLESLYFIDYIGYNWRWGGITSGRLVMNQKRVFKLLDFVKEFYSRRFALLSEYKYEKGYSYLTIELVNYLYDNIVNLASRKTPTADVLNYISEYVKFSKPYLHYIKNWNTERLDVFQTGDEKAIYDYCHQLYMKSFFRNTLKRLVHKLAFT